MSMKYLVPALAVASGAYAQSSCSVSGTTTINAAADASALSGCQTFSGSIAIATGLADAVMIPGVRRITGDLIAVSNPLIPSISASSLQRIDGRMNLDDLQVLSTLSFPMLTSVDSIVWNALAGLQLLSFTTGVQMANRVDIQNTQLQSLDGINLAVVDTVTIANNNWLNDISMQLGNISTSLTIESNGPNVSAIFPNLIWANNMTFRNVSQIALNSLVSVNGSLGFLGNNFASLQCANLTQVGTNKGDLTIVNNNNLMNASFPSLKRIGGSLTVQNNTMLKSVDGFPKLVTITGAVGMTGAFNNISIPTLNEVDGAFSVSSTNDISSDCSTFKALGSKVRGKFSCAGVKAASNSASGTSSGGASKSTQSGSANGMFVPTAAAGFMGVVAAMFGLL